MGQSRLGGLDVQQLQLRPDRVPGRRSLARRANGSERRATAESPGNRTLLALVRRDSTPAEDEAAASADSSTAAPVTGSTAAAASAPAPAGPSPPLYWGRFAPRSEPVALARSGATLEGMASFLYGTPVAALDLASLNDLEPSTPLAGGVAVFLTGDPLTERAAGSLASARLLPAGCGDPDLFVARKKMFDTLLEMDFISIVRWIDQELPYVNLGMRRGGGGLPMIFRRWGEEPFTEYPWAYPNGGDYLDRLFLKLTNKTKILSGVFTDEWTNYYSLLFNHFDPDDEIAAIRDRHSVVNRGDSGIKELSFASMFWEDVKSGAVRDRIFAYGKGLAKGAYAAGKGTLHFAKTLVTDPGQAWRDLKSAPGAIRKAWEHRSELWDRFANASPEKQAEMIGELFGQLEFAIGTAPIPGAAAKGLARLAELPGAVGTAAKVLSTVVNVPSKVLGGAGRALKTIAWKGVEFAAEGAKWAARGVLRFAGKVIRGTWSVVEETLGGVTQKLYYFYDEAGGVLRQIEERIAKLFVKCKSPCNLTPEAIEDLTRAGKFHRLDPGPRPSAIADELEEVLVGSAGESMTGADSVLRRLLAHKGTDVHEQVYRLLKAIESRLPRGSVFTEKMWAELEEVLGVRLPWRGKGIDIVVLDHGRKLVTGVDITRRAGVASHVAKGLKDLERLRTILAPKGWTVAEQLLEPQWIGRTPSAVVDELAGVLNALAGGT